ncbi:DUF2059 domain-containing protein [Marivirga tractuosa]|uniref:DUF2059 domain-containing protein n=1 Tax=Marivirga tractuosa TaxID=1006 RepID=UPI0035CFB7CF
MKKRFLTIALLTLVNLTVFGQVDTEYGKTLQKMFEVSGTEQTYQTVIKQIITMYKQQYPLIELEIWDDLAKEFTKTSLNELTDMLVPVYSKYMTIADLEELIKFYETPVGKKFAKNTPLIMQESMQVGQQWGMEISHDFEKKMEEKGY